MSGRKNKKAFIRFLIKLNNPPDWVGIIAGATALIALPLSVLILAINQAYKVQATIACVISGIIFLYAMVLTVNYLIRLRRKVIKVTDRYAFTRNLRLSYEYRSIAISLCAFLVNLGYTFFLASVAYMYDSVWYGALAVYYIVLAMSRGSILVQNAKHERRYRFDRHKLQKAKVGTYRFCGIMMLALTAALGVSVVELLINGAGPRAADGITSILAVLVVGKVFYGIRHFVRSSKSSDLVVRCVWYINLAVTLVSILTLQTIMLLEYPTEVAPIVFNGITGFSVCLITLALGVFMIIHSFYVEKRILAREISFAEANTEEGNDGYNREDYNEEK